MITNDQMGMTIVRSYPGCDQIDLSKEHTMEELYDQARTHQDFGDSLLDFILIEAREGGEVADGKMNIDQTIKVLERGRDDIQAVIDGLQKLDHADPDRATCEDCGTRFNPKECGYSQVIHGKECCYTCDECHDGGE